LVGFHAKPLGVHTPGGVFAGVNGAGIVVIAWDGHRVGTSNGWVAGFVMARNPRVADHRGVLAPTRNCAEIIGAEIPIIARNGGVDTSHPTIAFIGGADIGIVTDGGFIKASTKRITSIISARIVIITGNLIIHTSHRCITRVRCACVVVIAFHQGGGATNAGITQIVGAEIPIVT
jgi:hypothetical protein